MELAQRDGNYPNDLASRRSLYSIDIASVNTTTGELTVTIPYTIFRDLDIKGKAIVFPIRIIPLIDDYFDSERQQNLPAPLTNQLYYIKFAGTTNIAKIYGSLADWTAETNPIIFTVDQLRVKCELDTYSTHDPNPTSFTIKPPCRAATTANITLSGTQTIDSVVLIEGDRVLVKNQTISANNGIYDVSSGAWTRAADYSYGRLTTRVSRYATNENQVLSGILDPLTGKARIVGGRSLVVGQTILLMNQDDPTENDLWTTSSGAWSRDRITNPTSFDITNRLYILNIPSAGAGEKYSAAYVRQWFTINLDVPITIGTTPITIEMTKEPVGIFVDTTYTFILEGSANKLKGFFGDNYNVRIGITPLIYTTSPNKFYFDYAFKKYPSPNATYTTYYHLLTNGVTAQPMQSVSSFRSGGALKIPEYTLGVTDPEYIYGFPRYPRVTTPQGYPRSSPSGTASTTPQPMPLTLTIYLPQAHLITGGSGFLATPYTRIELGDITETLTYSEAAGAWVSELVNYYEIPGRMVIYNPGQLYQLSYGSSLFIDSRYGGQSFDSPYPGIFNRPCTFEIWFSHQQAARKKTHEYTGGSATHPGISVYYNNDYYVYGNYFRSTDPNDISFISSLASPFSPALP